MIFIPKRRVHTSMKAVARVRELVLYFGYGEVWEHGRRAEFFDILRVIEKQLMPQLSPLPAPPTEDE